MSISNAIASVAVKDLKSASQWYERLFGRPPDSRPMPELAERLHRQDKAFFYSALIIEEITS